MIVGLPCVLNTHMYMLQLNLLISSPTSSPQTTDLQTRFSGKDVDQLFPACRPVACALLHLLLHVEQLL